LGENRKDLADVQNLLILHQNGDANSAIAIGKSRSEGQIKYKEKMQNVGWLRFTLCS
jgi:hypothetical protein